MKHGPVRAYVLIENKHQILMVRNWLGSGKWSFPGGGVHRGEDSKVGACREVFEEVGILLKPSDLKQLTAGFTKYFFGGKKFIIYRAELIDKPKIKITPELTGYFWVARNEVRNYRITNEVDVAVAASSAS